MSIPTFNDNELMRYVRESVINPVVLKVNELDTTQQTLKTKVDNLTNAKPVTYTGELKKHELVAWNPDTNSFEGSGVLGEHGSIVTAPGSVDMGPHRLSSSGENSLFTYLPTGASYSPLWQTYTETDTSRGVNRVHTTSIQENVVRFSDTSAQVTNPVYTFNVPSNETVFRLKLNFVNTVNFLQMEAYLGDTLIWRNLFEETFQAGEHIIKFVTPLDLRIGLHKFKLTSPNGDVVVLGDASGNPAYSVWLREWEEKPVAWKEELDAIASPTPFDDSHLMRIATYDADNDGVVDQAEKIKGADAAGANQYYGTDGSHILGFHSLPQTTSHLGDMTKAEYDTNNDGVVDHADKANSLMNTPENTNNVYYGIDSNGVLGWHANSAGDMTKAVYDTNDTGIVDSSEKVNGVDSAGPSKYYGTDSSQTIGFHNMPVITTADKGVVHIEDNHVLYQNNQWDPTTGAFPSGAKVGYIYQASKVGEVDNVLFNEKDFVLAVKENPSTTNYEGNWIRISGTKYVHSIMGVSGAIDSSHLKTMLESIGVRFINEMKTSKAYFGFSVDNINNETLVKGLTSVIDTQNAYQEYVLTQPSGSFGYAILAVPKKLGDKIGHIKIKSGLSTSWSTTAVSVGGEDYIVFKSPYVFHNSTLTIITEV